MTEDQFETHRARITSPGLSTSIRVAQDIFILILVTDSMTLSAVNNCVLCSLFVRRQHTLREWSSEYPLAVYFQQETDLTARFLNMIFEILVTYLCASQSNIWRTPKQLVRNSRINYNSLRDIIFLINCMQI